MVGTAPAEEPTLEGLILTNLSTCQDTKLITVCSAKKSVTQICDCNNAQNTLILGLSQFQHWNTNLKFCRS